MKRAVGRGFGSQKGHYDGCVAEMGDREGWSEDGFYGDEDGGALGGSEGEVDEFGYVVIAGVEIKTPETFLWRLLEVGIDSEEERVPTGYSSTSLVVSRTPSSNPFPEISCCWFNICTHAMGILSFADGQSRGFNSRL